MDAVKITELINKVWDAVNESKIGPIINKMEDGKTVINHIPYDAFRQVLGSELPSKHESVTSLTQAMTGNLDMKMEEPGDNWKK